MNYNLLLNTSFEKQSHWKFINCRYENGYLISDKKVFGIEQELILPNTTKLYFRWNYKTQNVSVKDVKIGIQNGKTLNINRRVPKALKKQSISVIDVAKYEKVKLHLIFESTEDTNRVYIDSPILVDLNQVQKSTWIKWLLDKSIFFMNGYNYINEYKDSEITGRIKDFQGIQAAQAKIGCIVETLDEINIPLSCDLIENNYYLVKLDYEQINKFGVTEFKYGELRSSSIDDEQIYLIFRANKNDYLSLNMRCNDVLSYKVNLKHILLINITKMKLQKSDIPYLPFVE